MLNLRVLVEVARQIPGLVPGLGLARVILDYILRFLLWRFNIFEEEIHRCSRGKLEEASTVERKG